MPLLPWAMFCWKRVLNEHIKETFVRIVRQRNLRKPEKSMQANVSLLVYQGQTKCIRDFEKSSKHPSTRRGTSQLFPSFHSSKNAQALSAPRNYCVSVAQQSCQGERRRYHRESSETPRIIFNHNNRLPGQVAVAERQTDKTHPSTTQ